jgi:putative PIN family toxin of toxin-antitoxin system
VLIVCDTNVLVSGILNPNGPPGRIVDLLAANAVQVAFDDRIISEYSTVLQRPRFGFRPATVEALIDYIRLFGTRVTAMPLDPARCPDPKDLPFAEVAVSGEADFLVTGNAAHYRFLPNHDALVVSPAELVRRLAG